MYKYLSTYSNIEKERRKLSEKTFKFREERSQRSKNTRRKTADEIRIKEKTKRKK